MTYPTGVELEQENALQDAQDYLYERGVDITILITNESDVTRDRYNSIIKRNPTSFNLHAFPVNYNPTREMLEKAGIKEDVDVLITLATKDFTDNGLSYDSIDTIRWEVILNGETYLIKDKNKQNHFSHVYLNIVLGLFKK